MKEGDLMCLCSCFGRFVLLVKQLLLSQLISAAIANTYDFVNSLTARAKDGVVEEAYFKTCIVFDAETGMGDSHFVLFLALQCYRLSCSILNV